MKILSLILLLLVSTNVFAEWTRVADTFDGDITAYIDYGTIKKKNNKVKIWTLYDFKTVQQVEKVRYLSEANRKEYDCREETLRVLDIYWHSKNMRTGEVIFSGTNFKHEAVSIVPGSVEETLFNIACGKK